MSDRQVKDQSVNRVVTQNEIEAVMLALSKDFYDQDLNDNKTIYLMSCKFASRAVVFVSYVGTEIAGFISFYCNDEKSRTAYLSMLIVSRDYQRLGMGRLLMNTMVEYCLKHGYSKFRLEVNNRNLGAITFYKNYGFSKECEKSGESSYYSLDIADIKAMR